MELEHKSRFLAKTGTQRKMTYWGVAKGSSVSWVAKFKGGTNSECKLTNGWSRSYKVIKLVLSAGNERSRSYKEINQHPSLPWNFITHGFLDPSVFPDLRKFCDFLRKSAVSCVLQMLEWESAKVSHKRVFALLTPEIRS